MKENSMDMQEADAAGTSRCKVLPIAARYTHVAQLARVCKTCMDCGAHSDYGFIVTILLRWKSLSKARGGGGISFEQNSYN